MCLRILWFVRNLSHVLGHLSSVSCTVLNLLPANKHHQPDLKKFIDINDSGYAIPYYELKENLKDKNLIVRNVY